MPIRVQRKTYRENVIAQTQNHACLALAGEADKVPAWKDYAQYCMLRERGLRKQAFLSLNSFLAESGRWSFDAKKTFVLWLISKMDTVEAADYGPYPQPVRARLFLPFFDEWLVREPQNDEARALYAQYLGEPKYYRHALSINPCNQRARNALALACIADMEFAMHHLPHYFIGDPHEMKAVAEEAREHIAAIDDRHRQEFLRKKLIGQEQLLEDWIEFDKEPNTDFEQWCRAKGREYWWVRAYYYER